MDNTEGNQPITTEDLEKVPEDHSKGQIDPNAGSSPAWKPPTDEELIAEAKASLRYLTLSLRGKIIQLDHVSLDISQVAHVYWGSETANVTLVSGFKFTPSRSVF